MRKIVKKWADSAVIVLTKDDMKIYGLAVGDIVAVKMMKIEQKKIEQEVK